MTLVTSISEADAGGVILRGYPLAEEAAAPVATVVQRLEGEADIILSESFAGDITV